MQGFRVLSADKCFATLSIVLQSYARHEGNPRVLISEPLECVCELKHDLHLGEFSLHLSHNADGALMNILDLCLAAAKVR